MGMWNFPSSPSMSACSSQSMLSYQSVDIASSPSDSPTISMSPICSRHTSGIEPELLRPLDVFRHLPLRCALLEERHDPLDGVGQAARPPNHVGVRAAVVNARVANERLNELGDLTRHPLVDRACHTP